MRVKAPFVGCSLPDGDIRTYLFARVGRWFLPALVKYPDESYHQVVGIVPGTKWGWFSCRLNPRTVLEWLERHFIGL